ncbi:hypothetical protein BU25DRAFT_224915 [Macroventuria anomochaeta]|uniref:Uncharacterized protein n=1 Tax=Macroventuria anomochaeta TaxID=301207 RepID=A0ACB6SAH6_9PLEO|nr:uncharacterized protein BU25DRAFT_224915 [Macroventuria anomochaeta]KAF2631136.1 hypothetical protein BU25DRAFT_224915 [Macroventuria anomochaeta]
MGIAILMAAVILRGKGTIVALHSSIVRDLAFSSSNAHLLSLLTLWSSLGSWRSKPDRKKNGRRLLVPLVTIWRLFCMMVLFSLLMAAVWITAYHFWDDWARCPARCIPKGTESFRDTPFHWAIASTYFLITQYGSFMMLSSEQFWGHFKALRDKCHTHSKSVQDSGCRPWIWTHVVLRWSRYLYFSGALDFDRGVGMVYCELRIHLQEPCSQ